MSDLERAQRRARTGATYVKRATAGLVACSGAENWGVRWLAGYEAETLLVVLLRAADELVAVLNEEDGDNYGREELLRDAREVARKLRDRRLSVKLSNVAGRTPQEAALFRAKAEALRR